MRACGPSTRCPAARASSSATSRSTVSRSKFGAQIADLIQIKVTGLACRIGQSTAQPRTSCVGELGAAPALEAAAATAGADVSVAEALGGLPPRPSRGE